MTNRYALLIANSEFEDISLTPLAAPKNDVLSLRDILKDSEIADYDVKFLLNADLDQVRTEISQFYKDRHRDDVTLLYYTGHGLRDEHGDLYFALPRTDTKIPQAMSLDADFLRKEMNRSRSRRQVLILDCCHSGAFGLQGQKGSGQSELNKADFDPKGYGRFVMAASTATQSAFERNGKSLFTHHLVEGLLTGEAAHFGDEITVNDLHEYVSQKIKATELPMVPNLWADEQTEPLVVAKNSTRRPLPKELEKLVWDEDPDKALGGVVRVIELLNGEDAKLAASAEVALQKRLDDTTSLAWLVGKKIKEALDSSEVQFIGEPTSESELQKGDGADAELKELSHTRKTDAESDVGELLKSLSKISSEEFRTIAILLVVTLCLVIFAAYIQY